jgi:hypothetical protein
MPKSPTIFIYTHMHDGDLDKWIYDYFMCRPIDYVLVDGLQGFQNGPVPRGHDEKQTDKMNMRTIFAGADAVAIDTVCALVTGWDPQSIGYLNHFSARSAEAANSAQTGSPAQIVNHANTANPAQILTLGEPIDNLRKPFANKFPNLGGKLITDSEPPSLNGIKIQQNRIIFETDETAVKAELYIDGYFRSLKPVNGGENIFDLSGEQLSDGAHEIKIIVYDRFLNAVQGGKNVP